MVSLLPISDIQDANIDTAERILIHSAQQLRRLNVGENNENVADQQVAFTYPIGNDGSRFIEARVRLRYNSRAFHENGGLLLPAIVETSQGQPQNIQFTSIPTPIIPFNLPAIPEDISLYEQLLFWAASIIEPLGETNRGLVEISVFDANQSGSLIDIRARFLFNFQRWHLGGDLISSVQALSDNYNLAESPVETQSPFNTEVFPVNVETSDLYILGNAQQIGFLLFIEVDFIVDINAGDEIYFYLGDFFFEGDLINGTIQDGKTRFDFTNDGAFVFEDEIFSFEFFPFNGNFPGNATVTLFTNLEE